MFHPSFDYPEHRALSVINPYVHIGISRDPVMAMNSKVCRVAGRSKYLPKKTFPIRDHILGEDDLYAEFEGMKDPKTHYVMATKCLYTQKDIRACLSAICK